MLFNFILWSVLTLKHEICELVFKNLVPTSQKTLLLNHNDLSLASVQEISHCLFWEFYGICKYALWVKLGSSEVFKQAVHVAAILLRKFNRWNHINSIFPWRKEFKHLLMWRLFRMKLMVFQLNPHITSVKNAIWSLFAWITHLAQTARIFSNRCQNLQTVFTNLTFQSAYLMRLYSTVHDVSGWGKQDRWFIWIPNVLENFWRWNDDDEI